MKIAKKILCLVIVSLLMLHTNYVFLYYSLYEINKTGLTESCCEKKVDNCDAHCYLDKKINEDNNDSKGTTVEMKLKISEYIVKEYSPVLLSEKNKDYTFHNNISFTKGFSSDIEHPPKI
ncbi:MAG: hypothetical protein ABI462_09500 [Ignavibacteria bacterium]